MENQVNVIATVRIADLAQFKSLAAALGDWVKSLAGREFETLSQAEIQLLYAVESFADRPE